MSNSIGDFGAIEIAENTYRLIRLWNSRYQFSKVCKSIYSMAAFTLNSEDLDDNCALYIIAILTYQYPMCYPRINSKTFGYVFATEQGLCFGSDVAF